MNGEGATPAQPAKPTKPNKTEEMSRKSLYLIGAVIIIVILLVTVFYVVSVMPQMGQLTKDDCGNGVCDTGETADNCPEDCQQEGPPPTEGQSFVSFGDPSTAGRDAAKTDSSGTPVPVSYSVNNGETFTMNVIVSNVNDLFGFQFNVQYNPSIIEFQGFGEGGFLKQDGRSTFCLDLKKETGLVKNLVCTRLGRGSVSGEGVLGTLTFSAVGTGTSQVTLTNVKLANLNAEKIDSGVSNGEVTVS